MPQAVAHGTELTDRPVEFIRLRGEHFPIDARSAIRREHPRHLIERKTRSAPDADEREAFQDARIEQTAETSPSNGRDQPLLLVESQRRGRNTGAACHLADIQVSHPLDLKLT